MCVCVCEVLSLHRQTFLTRRAPARTAASLAEVVLKQVVTRTKFASSTADENCGINYPLLKMSATRNEISADSERDALRYQLRAVKTVTR